jgi:hypothetical protein
MSNPTHIQSFLDSKISMLLAVDEFLSAWNGEGCLQFPNLLGSIQAKLGWDDKQLRANDPIIREYIRNHPDWYVTRGAHGGIMRMSEKQKKEELLAAKIKAKADLNAILDAKVKAEAAAKAVAIQPVIADNTNNSSDTSVSE